MKAGAGVPPTAGHSRGIQCSGVALLAAATPAASLMPLSSCPFRFRRAHQLHGLDPAASVVKAIHPTTMHSQYHGRYASHIKQPTLLPSLCRQPSQSPLAASSPRAPPSLTLKTSSTTCWNRVQPSCWRACLVAGPLTARQRPAASRAAAAQHDHHASAGSGSSCSGSTLGKRGSAWL